MSDLKVGTGETYSTIAAAVSAAQDGDRVLVDAGTYQNDFFTISHKITLQSVGGLAIIDATSQPGNGKGAIVVDNDVTIDGFGVTGVSVPDGNGAGIRYDNGQMTVENSVFWNNQDGILANADPNGNIVISNSEFGFNGVGDGYTHNLYVNGVNSLTVSGSYFHDSNVGHEIKSRALTTTITGNRIEDNQGNGSYDIDLPSGGNAVVQNNVIEKGASAENPYALHFGGEGTAYAGSSLTVSGNTLLNDDASGRLLLNQTGVTADVDGNGLYGFAGSSLTSGPVTLSGNTTLAARPGLDLSSMIPGQAAGAGAGGVAVASPAAAPAAPQDAPAPTGQADTAAPAQTDTPAVPAQADPPASQTADNPPQAAQTPIDQMPTDQTPTDQAPIDQAPIDQAPAVPAPTNGDTSAPGFVGWTDTATGSVGQDAVSPIGPGGPGYLEHQYIWAGNDSVSLSTDTPNVFLKSGAGDDALSVVSGQNVLDGGSGSNFLTGGSGIDAFYVDARGDADVWSTVVNFHIGDTATLWGFSGGASGYTWDAAASGAAGAQGATLRETTPQGTHAAFTFAGLTVDQGKSLVASSGTVGGVPYLLLYNQGV